MLRTVKLKKNARTEALERGADVGFLFDPNQDVRGRDANGNEVDFDAGGVEVTVTSREYHRLQAMGLLEEGSAQLVAPAADQPEAEAAQAEAKQDQLNAMAQQRAGDQGSFEAAKLDEGTNPGGTVTKDRGPSGTSRSAGVDGAGHKGDLGASNKDVVQREIRVSQARGEALREEQGSDQSRSEDQSRAEEKSKAEDQNRAKAEDPNRAKAEDKSKAEEKSRAEEGKAKAEEAKSKSAADRKGK
jgi:hypothetical protein